MYEIIRVIIEIGRFLTLHQVIHQRVPVSTIRKHIWKKRDPSVCFLSLK